MEKEKSIAQKLKQLRKINVKIAFCIFIVGIMMFLITNPIPNEYFLLK